jgi:hypothetical protein
VPSHRENIVRPITSQPEVTKTIPDNFDALGSKTESFRMNCLQPAGAGLRDA